MQTAHTVSIKKFYARRLLRTWPLYLTFGTLVTCLIDLVLRKTGDSAGATPVLNNLFYLYTFSINYQLLFAAYNRGIFEIAWSVCIEEQFYLVWPWMVKSGLKNMHKIILLFIFVGIICSAVLHLLSVKGVLHTTRNPVYIFSLCRFGHLAIGAYAGYILFNKNSLKN